MLLSLAVLLAGLAAAEPPAELRAAAEKGDAEAQYELADAYYFGRGTAHDCDKTVEWRRKAADQGHAGAIHDMGTYALRPKSCLPQDYKEARRWFSLAAALGDGRAMRALGVMDLGGLGGPRDKESGHRWIAKADHRGQGPQDTAEAPVPTTRWSCGTPGVKACRAGEVCPEHPEEASGPTEAALELKCLVEWVGQAHREGRQAEPLFKAERYRAWELTKRLEFWLKEPGSAERGVQSVPRAAFKAAKPSPR
jgi:hypothetical protein